ncbi:MAG: hypothetical protein JWR60_4129 [Polaromonas sp.]|nr:hypothetical protein [Polaromonas sp.]
MDGIADAVPDCFQFLWAGLSLFAGLQTWGLHKAAGFAVLMPIGYVWGRSKRYPAIAGLRSAAWTVALLYILQVALAAASKSPDLGWLKAAHLANGPLLLLAAARLYQRTLLSR